MAGLTWTMRVGQWAASMQTRFRVRTLPTAGRWPRSLSVVLPPAFAVALSGCAVIEERVSLPADVAAAVDPVGYEGLRFWGDSVSPALRTSIRTDYRRVAAAAAAGSKAVSTQRADFLALSGGGGDGAFGAGVLKGWSERGDRPTFEVVTGVSTGALAAPFAFLGPGYDQALAEIYTTYSDHDLYTSNGPLGLIGSSLNDTTPLRQLVRRYMTPEVIDAIAAAGRTGRRLLVETTNLDAQRPVIWDLTALAASDRPDRRDLFVRILLASAAIPAVFPAQHFPVTQGDKTFDELHVDGGVSAQVFFTPPQLKLADEEQAVFGHVRRRTLYAIRNGKLAPEYQAVEDGTLDVAQRAIATMIKNQGRANIASLQQGATENGARMVYAAIPNDLQGVPKGNFDPVYMKGLYDVGFAVGRQGAWTGGGLQLSQRR